MQNSLRKTVVKNSLTDGKGVFAAKDLLPNEEVLNWKRRVRTAEYLNHSCLPSCYTRESDKNSWLGDILLSGNAGVKTGEEITFDYRKTRWQHLWRRNIKKRCGCSLCRKP